MNGQLSRAVGHVHVYTMQHGGGRYLLVLHASGTAIIHDAQGENVQSSNHNFNSSALFLRNWNRREKDGVLRYANVLAETKRIRG